MSHESQISKPDVLHKHEEGTSQISKDAWAKQTGSDTSQMTHAKSRSNAENLLPKMQITMSGDEGEETAHHTGTGDEKQAVKRSDGEQKETGADGGRKEMHVGYTDKHLGYGDNADTAKQLVANAKKQFDK